MLEQKEITRTGVIRVVIVEDYKLARMGLASALKSDPEIEVIGEAESGEKGVEIVTRLQPDVVFMDLGLPGINGIEATQKIKRLYPDIRVIVYTSHESEEQVIAALGAGANAYCVKDSSPESLIAAIKAVSEGAAWLDPSIASVVLKVFQRISPKPHGSDSQRREGSEYNSPPLTERELEVLRHLVEGKSNTEIAKELIISSHTAKAHVCNILQKLAVHDRVQAAVKAIKEGLV